MFRFLRQRHKEKKKGGSVPKETHVAESFVTVAIDFGTTYSGWAFSFKHDFKKKPPKIRTQSWTGPNKVTQKTPTSILINPDGETLDSFGYTAEENYSRLCEDGSQDDWFFFQRFKMLLHREQGLHRELVLEEFTGKKILPALKIFSLSIKFLRDDVLKELNKTIAGNIVVDDIHWVLTVPAIWNDAAKQFMREAATEAGIKDEKLSICLEPEAASIYCCHLPVSRSSCNGAEASSSLSQFANGTQYMVLDAGGGTVDITIHEKTDHGKLREVYKACGDAWGSTKVDAEFEKFLVTIVGQVVMSHFKANLHDYMDILYNFEIKKRSDFDNTRPVIVRLPQSLLVSCNMIRGKSFPDLVSESRYKENVSVNGDKMKINAEVFEGFYEPAISSIVEYVDSLLKKDQLRNCSAILMVGGFSTSPLLQKNVKARFPNLTTIIPDDAEVAVLKGAVIFGHRPRTITERVCKYTYGTGMAHEYDERCDHIDTSFVSEDGTLMCDDIFIIHAQIGQSVKIDEEHEEQIYYPIDADQSEMVFTIYASHLEDPKLVTEEGCRQIGELIIPIPDTSLGTEREFGVSFIFGGTEITVKVIDKATGFVKYTSANFLG